MDSPTIDTTARAVFRDEIKQYRGAYFIVYQPADVRQAFASIQVVFPYEVPDTGAVMRTMEHELERWLKTYPVPTMVSAFNAKEELVRLSDKFGESHLMGYIDLATGKLVRRWGLFGNDEMPPNQMEADYLERVYADVPSRLQHEVREKVLSEAQIRARAIWLIVFFVAVVPVLIEIISLGVAWLGYVLSAVSISTGLYKAGKAAGWLKPCERERQEAEKKRKMEHYFYHCERNPRTFSRLKIENFEREATEQTRKEAEALRTRHA